MTKSYAKPIQDALCKIADFLLPNYPAERHEGSVVFDKSEDGNIRLTLDTLKMYFATCAGENGATAKMQKYLNAIEIKHTKVDRYALYNDSGVVYFPTKPKKPEGCMSRVGDGVNHPKLIVEVPDAPESVDKLRNVLLRILEDAATEQLTESYQRAKKMVTHWVPRGTGQEILDRAVKRSSVPFATPSPM